MGAKHSKSKKKFKVNMDVAAQVPTFLAMVSEVMQSPELYSDENYINEIIIQYAFVIFVTNYHYNNTYFQICRYCKFIIALAEDVPTKISSDVMWMWHLVCINLFVICYFLTYSYSFSINYMLKIIQLCV